MDGALLTIAAGLRAQTESLDLLGNNIANSATTGYKADNEFYRLFMTPEAAAGTGHGEALWMPVVEGSLIDYQQGPLTQTGSPFDIALLGPGFLKVEGPAGVLYTRNGHMNRSPTGKLVSEEGFAVLDAQDRPVELPGQGKLAIGPDGAVSIEGVTLAQLGVVEFDGRPPLMKAGSSYFRAVSGQEPRPAGETVVQQGSLEGSNVNAPESAVRLMLASRNFEMLRRIASMIGDEMNGRAVDELGRTN
jgi:flagellar basal body rod protein FlgG